MLRDHPEKAKAIEHDDEAREDWAWEAGVELVPEHGELWMIWARM